MQSIFQVVEKSRKRIEWSEECERAFEELKRISVKLPTLQAPKTREKL